MKTDIMGIAFDNVTMQEALDKATAILQGNRDLLRRHAERGNCV